MKDRSPFNVFRIVAPEYKDIEDEIVETWIDLTAPMVSKRQFRKAWTQAVALLTAHRMKLAGYGSEADDALADINNLHAGGLMRISNVSEGDTSVAFNTQTGQYTAADAELGMTIYGIQYLQLRRKYIITINIS